MGRDGGLMGSPLRLADRSPPLRKDIFPVAPPDLHQPWNIKPILLSSETELQGVSRLERPALPKARELLNATEKVTGSAKFSPSGEEN